MKEIKCYVLWSLVLLAAMPLSASTRKEKPTYDSTYFAKLLQLPIQKIEASKNGNRWIIAGEDSSMLFRVTRQGCVFNMKDSANLPSDTRFSDILIIKNRRVMVGTSNHYIYRFSRDKVGWINSSYGLSDSVIRSFEWDKRQKLLYVKTAKSRFLVKHHNKLMSIRFSEIHDTLSTFDEIRSYLRKNFRWTIQKGICEVAADIDFSFRRDKFISDEDLQQIKSNLHPGDIIIKRNDEQLSNVGIPGFWTHSGIYVGSLAQIDSCFAGISMLNQHSPSDFLKEYYPNVYEDMQGRDDLIVEAIGKGVVINPVEHIAKVDYLAALRTKLDKESLFKSILIAFEYLDTPYDYLFDFSNDNQLVCSELIFNAFKPTANKNGVSFIMGTLNGKVFLSPNDIAKQYAIEDTMPAQQLDLVFFYDAERRQRKSVRRNEAAFAKSWKRKSLY